VTPSDSTGAPNVGVVDDHQHSTGVSASPFAPFRHRAFFWLWLGVVIASIGSWGQTVGAQWLFVNDPNAATIVPLVQTASTLPMMLLALPAGVLADAFDRRWMMFVIQVYFITASALLAVLTALGMMPPVLLLMFTFAVGAGHAVADLAGHDHRIGAALGVRGRDPTGHGQRQCLASGRSGDRPRVSLVGHRR
jgi:MFS family permease